MIDFDTQCKARGMQTHMQKLKALLKDIKRDDIRLSTTTWYTLTKTYTEFHLTYYTGKNKVTTGFHFVQENKKEEENEEN